MIKNYLSDEFLILLKFDKFILLKIGFVYKSVFSEYNIFYVYVK